MTGAYRLHRTAALRNPRSQPKRQTVQTIRVVTAVWARALQLADGDTRRLRIIDAENVVVLNNPRRRMS
jgi:hypothetical protein